MNAATGPPRKRKGVCENTPNPKLRFNSPQNNSGNGFTQPVCVHRFTVTQQKPLGRIHYSKEICIVCGTFLRWLPKPENLERQPFNAYKLARLGMCERLPKWERNFVREISQRRRVSPKELKILERLCREYLEAKQ